jgi:hypothetical protein
MHLADRIHLVGSGSYGLGLIDPYDCQHVVLGHPVKGAAQE